MKPTFDNLQIQFLNQEFNIKFGLTDKCFFIYNLKIASRFLYDIADIPSLVWDISGSKLNIINYSKHNHDQDFTEYVSNINEEWELIKDGNSKKDILILYRNPINRFITGIVQDTSGLFNNPNGFHLIHTLLESKGHSDRNLKYLPILFKKGPHNNYYTEYIELQERIMKDLLDIYYESFVSNGNFESSHCNSHLLPLVSILTTTNIDLNKVKMIDIDEESGELEKYLKKIEIFKTPTNVPYDTTASNNPQYKNYIRDKIIEDNQINKKLYDLLKGELYSYNILKSIHKSLGKPI